jgi:hypothetical protein
MRWVAFWFTGVQPEDPDTLGGVVLFDQVPDVAPGVGIGRVVKCYRCRGGHSLVLDDLVELHALVGPGQQPTVAVIGVMLRQRQRSGGTSGAYNRSLCYLVAVGHGKDGIGRRKWGFLIEDLPTSCGG